MNSNKQNLINKIKYRSQYRGTKEMDILMTNFVSSLIKDLDLNELKELDYLVNLDDETLVNIKNNILNEKIPLTNIIKKFVNSIIQDLNINQLKELDNLINLGDEELIKITNEKINKNENKVVLLFKEFKKNY